MKAHYIKLLVVTVSLALLGMVGVQVYWINNAFSLQQEEFERNVNDALSAVVKELERQEAVHHLKSHEEGKFLFFDSTQQAEFLTGADTAYDYLFLRQVDRYGDQVEVTITEESNGQRQVKSAQTDVALIDSLRSGFALSKDFGSLEGALKTGANQTPQLEEVLKQRITEKKAIVGDIVKRLIEINLFEPISKRIDQQQLESLIQSELRFRGIDTRFEYAIVDEYDKIQLGNIEEFVLPDSSRKTTEVRLFPNDVIQDPHYLRVYFPKQTSFIFESIWLVLATSLLLLISLGLLFYYSLSTIINQKKNSEIKNDFINNMTHEFKTPISTISLACEALNDPDIESNPTLVNRYIGMVRDENKRLGMLVEEVLQSAVFDKGEFKLKLEQLDAHQLLQSVLEKVNMQVREKQGTLSAQLEASNSIIEGDRVHLSNVVYNLVDNAIKYSKERPEITVRTENASEELIIKVQDQGIGISKENQKRIFDRLYRVPTGNIHDVKGFGLGLSYVKIIVEKLGGTVQVKSQMGKGSTFQINLPLYGSK